jgi:diguanylate cyclase (GGDEF)-like protein
MNENVKNSLLLVDDEKENLTILSIILEKKYTLFTASSGIKAIEMINEHKPDVVLLDILMPGMDGYQTLIKLKEDEKTKTIPVIIITGLDDVEFEEKGLSLGAADYITKPFSSAVVGLRVRNQIQILNQLRTIERLSMMDQLTNLPNRRNFDERIKMEWNQAIREKTSITIMMLDLDKFKLLNDTYGHQQGDVVLKAVSRIFAKSFKRPGDFAARWGGEEFVVLLPNTHLEGALDVAENIRKDIENLEILGFIGEERIIIKITISIGINTETPVQNSSLNKFISGADNALYAAKQAGRNRVEHC